MFGCFGCCCCCYLTYIALFSILNYRNELTALYTITQHVPTTIVKRKEKKRKENIHKYCINMFDHRHKNMLRNFSHQLR